MGSEGPGEEGTLAPELGAQQRQTPLAQPEASRKKKKRKRPPRRRPEAVLIRVPDGVTYIDTYRSAVTFGRAALTGIKAVKKTRLGHVLLELEAKGSAAEISAALITATKGALNCAPL